MLIETSNRKTPGREDLGTRTAPLVSSDGLENRHMAWNLRLVLMAINMVELYMAIHGVGGLRLEDDIVPAVNPWWYNGKYYLDNNQVL